jgi:hypothetical protein
MKNRPLKSDVLMKLKVGLHYSDYRSKLVPLEEQKNIFYILKRL